MNVAPSMLESSSMQQALAAPPQPLVLRSASGVWVELLSHGGLRRMGCGDDLITLFVGQESEAPLSNLWLRRHEQGQPVLHPLLGPNSRGRWTWASATQACFEGSDGGSLRWQVQLRLADDAPTWFWHVQLCNDGPEATTIELVQVQDVALCAYAAVRLNEYYVSQYIDFTPLSHPDRGTVLAVRQNQPVSGRHPWMVAGSLRHTHAWSTDAMQSHGLAARAGLPPAGLMQGLPASRLQHEHACLGLQDAALTLGPGATAWGGFFGSYVAHHEGASHLEDLGVVNQALQHVQARPDSSTWVGASRSTSSSLPGLAPSPSLFAQAPWLEVLSLGESELTSLFGPNRAHGEHGPDGGLWSFFASEGRHVVLRAKELQVLRPHGHILRGGPQWVPDETALTSTVWMGGVFHSMVTQGHVSINRALSTTRSYLGLFRSQGLRIFVNVEGTWCQLGTPSAFEMQPEACRWVYRHAGGLLAVRSAAEGDALTLTVQQLKGTGPVRLRVTAHVALGGDDGSATTPLTWSVDPDQDRITQVRLVPPVGSELAERFPLGDLRLTATEGASFTQVGSDALLYADGLSRGEPFLCLDTEASPDFSLRITGHLVTEGPVPNDAWRAAPLRLRCHAPETSTAQQAVAQLQDFAPWLAHNALIHFLAPRGLEQYSGGGWGTRDVCQGPLEMLLALGRTGPVRDLLLRTFAAQNPDGDWPQWFMFFPRDAHIRAGDSHGDIVFWPVLGLARYLLATADAGLLDEAVPFHGERQPVTLRTHVDRALDLMDARCIAGTQLASYWHGDWNDSLQPADPALRERMCSAWTVTLHHQTLTTLARALRSLTLITEAESLEVRANQVAQDFQRHLVVDDVVTGYALFAENGHADSAPQLLIHPRDTVTGLKYSLLPMMHAVLEDMLDPEQARHQCALMSEHLLSPDGARLFDAPMAYRGGPQRLFQRAESSTFFGREIGVMYMHAHLRYAEMLAHMGHADAFFQALSMAHPIGLRQRLPSAAARQANCYYSSSDAAFTDRYEAVSGYSRIAAGTVALEGGWRIYSSGPGIALRLLLCKWLGVECTQASLLLDPVMPPSLDGLEAELQVCGRPMVVHYRVGPAGHGVQAVTLNGQALAFEREPNRYRLGAAAVARSTFEPLLNAQGNRLVLQLG